MIVQIKKPCFASTAFYNEIPIFDRNPASFDANSGDNVRKTKKCANSRPFRHKATYWGIIITSSKVNQSHEGDRDHDDIFDELV